MGGGKSEGNSNKEGRNAGGDGSSDCDPTGVMKRETDEHLRPEIIYEGSERAEAVLRGEANAVGLTERILVITTQPLVGDQAGTPVIPGRRPAHMERDHSFPQDQASGSGIFRLSLG